MSVSTTKTSATFAGITAGSACNVTEMKVLDASQITVFLAGTEIEAVLGVDYTVSVAGDNSGATVTPTASLVARTSSITVARVTDNTSDFNIAPNGKLSEARVTEQLDYGVMRQQERASDISRAVRAAPGETVLVLPSVSERKGKFMFFDAALGNPTAAEGTATLALPPGGVTGADLAPGAAVENIGYTPANAAAVATFFDGNDDNISDNSTAWLAARAASGSGGTIYVRRKTPGGKYRFIATHCDLSDRIVVVEEGVEFIGNLDMSVAVQAPDGLRMTMDFDYGGGLATYEYDVEVRQPASDARPLRPGPLKCEDRKDYFLPGGLISMEKVSWTTGTAFAADTVGAFASDGSVSWSNLTTDSYLRAALVPSWGEFGARTIRGSWGYVTGSNAYIAFAVECSQGWASIHVLGDGGEPAPYYAQEWHKLYSAGGAVGTKVKEFTWSGRTSMLSRLPRMTRWEFVPLDPYTMLLCFDGVEVRRMDLSALGEIQRHGPAVIGAIAGPVNVQFAYMHVSEGRRPRVGKTRRLVVSGDSRSDHTAPIMLPVQWPEFAAARLDDTYGCRVSSIVNLAVAGQRTSEQKLVLETWLAGQADVEGDVLVINLGTNDEQGIGYYPDSTPATVYVNQKAMIDLALSRGMFVVSVVFEAFYPRTLAAAETGVASQGQNVAQYHLGADLRGAVAQAALLADPPSKRKRVGIVDGMSLLGDELPYLLKRENFTSPRLADNIHGNSKYAYLFGEAIAEEIARVLLPPLGPTALVGLPVPAAAMAANFSAGADLHFSLEGATCRLQGTINKTSGSWLNAVLLTIPHYVRPSAAIPLLLQDGAGTVMTGSLYANGQLQVFTASPQSSIRFCLQWTIRR